MLKLKTLVMAVLFAAALTTTSDLMAQDADSTKEEESVGSAFSVSLGVDYTTHYFFRGILQEDQDSIIQPYAELGVELYSGDGALTSLGAFLGVWNSFHGGPTGDDGPTVDPESWYETDIYAGLTATFWDVLSISLTHTWYVSPNDSFPTVEEFAFSVGYDDSGHWDDISWFNGFAPSVTMAFEHENQADGGMNLGTYLELGIEPSFVLSDSEDYPITLGVPMTLGLSADDYYEGGASGSNDETFGFLDVGLTLGMPLAFVPKKFGEWEVSAGVHFLFLGETTEAINIGEDFEVYAGVGLGISF